MHDTYFMVYFNHKERQVNRLAGTTEYKNKWQQENRERINIVVPKGYKDKIKNEAEKNGESVNGYIRKAIDERMEREVFDSTEES